MKLILTLTFLFELLHCFNTGGVDFFRTWTMSKTYLVKISKWLNVKFGIDSPSMIVCKHYKGPFIFHMLIYFSLTNFLVLNCRGIVIACVRWWNISKYTERGEVFLNQTLIKSKNDKVKWVLKMDSTPPVPLLSGRRQYMHLLFKVSMKS